MRFFNRVILQTPESVELEFTLAGIGNRAFALLIDYTALGLLVALFIVLWLFISNQFLDFLIASGVNVGGSELWIFAILSLGSFAIYTGYFVCFEALWRGQTPGKRFAKIRVIRDDGRPIGLVQSTLRSLLRPIDDTLFLGVFLIALNAREKRLGDWVAGTLVVQEEQAIAPADFKTSEAAQKLAIELTQIADISQLLPDDFAVVREYLQRRHLIAEKARNEVNLKLARQVKQVIALEKVPPNITPDLFLEAIYLAYQRQSSR